MFSVCNRCTCLLLCAVFAPSVAVQIEVRELEEIDVSPSNTNVPTQSGHLSAALPEVATALQPSSVLSESLRKLSRTLGMDLVMLDEQESKNRGALCLDGSTTGYFHKPGSDEGKWIFWFNGGSSCANKTDCLSYLPINEIPPGADEYALLGVGDFANYHHVMFINCDLGYYLGDRDDPVVHNGQKLYSQGARIVKYVVDDLKANYSMTDVLFAGGSGGGYSLFIGADYFRSLMPSTVTRFGVAPINGWNRQEDTDFLAQAYDMHGNILPEACKNNFAAGEEHNCLDPPNAYRFIGANVFMVQLYDTTWQYSEDSDKSAFSTAWTQCLKYESSRCDSDMVDILQDTWDNFTSTLKTYPKYTQSGMGGWLSTCSRHIYYQFEEEFNKYTTEGVTAGEAIEIWWKNLGKSSPAKWYLPCTLGQAPNAQCEQTCVGAYSDDLSSTRHQNM